MPTATEYFGYDVINNGPLTTTFTAPTSCSTLSTGSPYVAMAANTTEIVAQLSCGTLQSLGDCHPSGSQLDSLRAAFATSPPQQGFIDYFSPGIACPAGWTTVGVAATVGGTLSVSGFFTENAYTALPSGIEYEALPFQSIFLKILGPSETLAFCCPSDYDVAGGGGCVSSLGPMTQSTACFNFVLPISDEVIVSSLDGSSISPALISVTDAVSSPYSTVTITYPSSEVASLVQIDVIGMLPLIYQATDTTSGSSASATTSTAAATTSNAAERSIGRPDLQLLWPVVIALVGVVFGAALMIPL